MKEWPARVRIANWRYSEGLAERMSCSAGKGSKPAICIFVGFTSNEGLRDAVTRRAFVVENTSDTNRAQDPIPSIQQCLYVYAFLQTKPCSTIIIVPTQGLLALLSDLLKRARCHRSLLPRPMSVQLPPKELPRDPLTSHCPASP
jgi:hypothetical protein